MYSPTNSSDCVVCSPAPRTRPCVASFSDPVTTVVAQRQTARSGPPRRVVLPPPRVASDVAFRKKFEKIDRRRCVLEERATGGDQGRGRARAGPLPFETVACTTPSSRVVAARASSLALSLDFSGPISRFFSLASLALLQLLRIGFAATGSVFSRVPACVRACACDVHRTAHAPLPRFPVLFRSFHTPR